MAYIGLIKDLQTTALGDLDVASPTPEIQLQFTYGVNSDETFTTTTGSGSIASSPPLAIVNSGASSSSMASLSSRDILSYRAGQGSLFIFTAIFTNGVNGNTQLAGAGDNNNGIYFGYNGTSFGVNRISNSTNNWIAQPSWNVDPMNGTGSSSMNLDPTKGNVYKIQMQWLGFGNINFFIQNPLTGRFVLVHTIQYANSFTQTSLSQPSLQLRIASINTTNTTNIHVATASMSACTEGIGTVLGNTFAYQNKQSCTTTEQVIFNIKNNLTFNGINNFKKVVLRSFSSLCLSNPANLSIVLNPSTTLSSYVNISPTSCSAADSIVTSATGGTLLAAYFLSVNNSRIQVDIAPLNLSLNPGDVVSIIGNTTTGSGVIHASLTWIES